jgi:hypothetical protein
VRTIELSSHPADALRLARQRLGNAGHTHLRDAIARHELLVSRASSARDRARAQRHWLAWLRGALAVSRLRRLAPISTPGSAVPGRAGRPIKGRGTDEQQVVADFAAVLGDEWALVRGYSNLGGEIDHLLLGPPGLIAIAEPGTAGGNAGRSPSIQLNEPADLLERFLTSHGAMVPMLRVVLLTHPGARLGRCESTTVHIATSAAELAFQLADIPPVIGAVQRARLEELIARDRRYRERSRHRSGSPTRLRTAAARTGRSARSASR